MALLVLPEVIQGSRSECRWRRSQARPGWTQAAQIETISVCYQNLLPFLRFSEGRPSNCLGEASMSGCDVMEGAGRPYYQLLARSDCTNLMASAVALAFDF